MIHSVRGGSAMPIILNCPGYPRMIEGIQRTSGEPAELGTCIHEANEFSLRLGIDTTDCVGGVFNKRELTQEMAESGQVFVAYMRLLQSHTGAEIRSEQKVTLFSLGEDVFGTADGVIIDLRNRRLYVVDYKSGYLVVEATSPQLIFYGIGVLDTFQLWDQIDEVVCVIVQPKADHIEGTVRYHVNTIQDMRQYHQQYAAVIATSRSPDAPTNAGDWCTYCPASPICRARVYRTLDLALPDKPVDKLDPAEISVIYNEIKTIQKQLEAISEHAVNLSVEGFEIEGYKLVQSYSRAACHDPDGFIAEAVNLGVPEPMLMQHKLKTMTALKKIVPVDIVKKFFTAAPTKPALAPLSDKRPATSKLKQTPSATGVFGALV